MKVGGVTPQMEPVEGGGQHSRLGDESDLMAEMGHWNQGPACRPESPTGGLLPSRLMLARGTLMVILLQQLWRVTDSLGVSKGSNLIWGVTRNWSSAQGSGLFVLRKAHLVASHCSCSAGLPRLRGTHRACAWWGSVGLPLASKGTSQPWVGRGCP